MILAIRTDRPEAELALWDGDVCRGHDTWHADRRLAESLTTRIEQFLAAHDTALAGLRGVGVYSGPGSFTGLRIGISVANALGSGLGVPVYDLSENSWGKPVRGEGAQLVLPRYGSEPHITAPRK